MFKSHYFVSNSVLLLYILVPSSVFDIILLHLLSYTDVKFIIYIFDNQDEKYDKYFFGKGNFCQLIRERANKPTKI